MYDFRYVGSPAVRLQLNAQMALFDGVYAAMLWSLQQVWWLRLQPRDGMPGPGGRVGHAPTADDPKAARGLPTATIRPDDTSATVDAARSFRRAVRAHDIHEGRIDGVIRGNDSEAEAAAEIDGPAGTISAQGDMQGNRVR